MEQKAVELKFEDGFLKILVDPNKDGEALCKFEVDLSEVADEIVGYFKKD